MKNIGIILIIIGAVMMIFTGFNIVTKKKVVDLGPVEINKDEKTPVRWTPIVGGIILVAGVVVTFSAKKS